jgi:hypothetical protein
VAEIRPHQPVAWARSEYETREYELDLLSGHPGRIDPVCASDEAPYARGDVVVNWHMRDRRQFPVFAIADHDLEIISDDDCAKRTSRMNRGEPPLPADA